MRDFKAISCTELADKPSSVVGEPSPVSQSAEEAKQGRFFEGRESGGASLKEEAANVMKLTLAAEHPPS